MVSILGSLQKSNKEIKSIAVINTSGEQVLKISDGIVYYSDNINHLDTPEIARAMSGKLSFSSVKSYGRSSYININIPIQLYVGKYVGVFSTNLSLASVYDIVNSTKIGNKGFVFITDNSGHVIFHPAGQINLNVFARQARSILKTAKKAGTVNYNNVPMLVTAIEDVNLNWDIFSVQPEAEAFQSASEMKNQVKVQTAKSLSSLKTQASHGLNSAIKNMETESGKSAEVSKKVMLTESEKTLKMTSEQLKPVAEKNTTDTVSQLQKQSTQEAQAAQGKIAIHSTTLIIIFIAIAGVIAVYIAKGFVNPIQKITNIAKIMSNDDLTAQIDENEQDEEEIDELYKSFSRLQNNLKKIITQIFESSERVLEYSDSLKATIEQAGKATELIASSVQSVAVGAEKQCEYSESAVAVASELSNEIQFISNEVQQVDKLIKTASENAKSGNVVVKQAIQQMNQINSDVEASADKVNILSKKSEEIDGIIEIITEIAGQTNLLSLNAAVEAARAGEEAKGFTVIAIEIRKLATQSAEAASNIARIIQEIKKEINVATMSMSNGTSSVKQGISMVDKAGSSFEEILNSVSEVNNKTTDVASRINIISEGTKSMVSLIQNVSNISQEFNGSTQDIAASAEEQTASMQEIVATTNVLSSMANGLINEVKTFKIDKKE